MAPCTGLGTTVRILDMDVFEAVEGVVIDSLGSAGDAHPGTLVPEKNLCQGKSLL